MCSVVAELEYNWLRGGSSVAIVKVVLGEGKGRGEGGGGRGSILGVNKCNFSNSIDLVPNMRHSNFKVKGATKQIH